MIDIDREGKVDLHIHTQASDGSWPVSEVLDQVKAHNISLFAITDHDSVDSIEHMLNLLSTLRREEKPYFIPGVELSARYQNRSMHILGLGIDWKNSDLLELGKNNRRLFDQYGDYCVETAQREYNSGRKGDGEKSDGEHKGISISFDDYDRYTYDHSRGGWKAYNYLLDKGVCQNLGQYFKLVGFPNIIYPHPRDVIEIIHSAKGKAIWAHPGDGFKSDEENLKEISSFGFDGFECFSCYHDQETCQKLESFCRKYDLLITAGSDCHGSFAGRTLGVPSKRLEEIRLGESLERF